MSRTEQAEIAMKQLGVKENALTAAFLEFEIVKNNFLYGEVHQQGVLTEKQRMIITVAALVMMEGGNLIENYGSASMIPVYGGNLNLKSMFSMIFSLNRS